MVAIASNPVDLERVAELRAEIARLESQLMLADRAVAVARARDDLIAFARLMRPHPDDPIDVTRSLYQAEKFHKVTAAALEEVDKGHILRLLISYPPRHGKTELASRMLPAFFVGRDPSRSVIFATYNEEFAHDIGREVRELMQSPIYQEIFPAARLAAGGKSAERLRTTQGGQLMFVGRGGSLTGRGADLLLIDDPIKDREEADSPTIRDKLWNWFTQVAHTRLMTASGRIVIIMTRWHEDDLIGRITDPMNPHYTEDQARKWKKIDLPAITGPEWGYDPKDDTLGRPANTPLWPDRFDIEYMRNMRELDPRGFNALFLGRPSPEDGEFFKAEYLRTYRAHELPPASELRFYSASDHAVSTRQDRDATVLGTVGVDDEGTIWVMPDVWWRRAQTDAVVEAMLLQMAKYKPLLWWAERGHISKAIGPFLRKRMREQQIYVAVDEVVPVADKKTRAQAIQGRMAMGRVRFPSFAPWWQQAKSELLKFPFGSNDDFVDFMSLIGLGLDKQVNASRPKPKKPEFKPGTLGWLKAESRRQRIDDMLTEQSRMFG